MQENIKAVEGGAMSAAKEKTWRVSFVIGGIVDVRAETPKEASEQVLFMGTEELVAASNRFQVQSVKEVEG
jgi:hypothetical protein